MPLDQFISENSSRLNDIESQIRSQLREGGSDQLFEQLVKELSKTRLVSECLALENQQLNKKVRALSVPMPTPLVDLCNNDFPDELLIDARMPLRGEDGFYAMEYTGSDAVRWTGPENSFSFSMMVDRSRPLAFELEVVKAIAEECCEDVTYEIDGVVKRLEIEGKLWKGIIPASGKPQTRVTFNLAKTAAPSELNESSTDHRRLGVAFKQMTIKPAMEEVKNPGSEQEELVRKAG